MADTFTPVQGFLAGIYHSVGRLVGAVTKHQLLANPNFDTGLITGWTDDCVPTSTVVVTANKGWKEGSYGAVMTAVGANKVGISQTIVLDAALDATEAAKYDVIAGIWCKFATSGKTATLTVSCLSAADGVLGTGSVTMISLHPGYGAQQWGYYSIRIDAVNLTKKIKFEVSDSGEAEVFYLDKASLIIVEQMAGAYGPLTMPYGWETQEVSTFAGAGTAGFKTFATTVMKKGELKCPAYWVSTEDLGEKMADGGDVFVAVFTKKGTKAAERFEFWSKVSGLDYGAPVDKVQESSITLTATGVIGYAHI
jgi:hypothetical protein